MDQGLMDDSSVDVVTETQSVSKRTGPRTGGPRPRRTFTPAQKLAHVLAYDEACAAGDGGAYLRREGIYSSSLSAWRQARDAGALSAGQGRGVGRLSPEQVEIARLRRELEVTRTRLSTTETALEIMGKARELLEAISTSSPPPTQPGRR